MLFRNGTDGFPFLLYLHEFVGRGFPVRTVFQCLGLFAEFRFLGQVLSLFLFQAFEECRLFREEPVACATETLENLHVHLLRGETNGTPFLLHLDDLLRLCLPCSRRLDGRQVDGFYFLAECGLVCQVFFFFLLQFLEILLMTFVHGGRCSLEACPDFFAQFFRYGTRFLEFLMQGLQLLESGYDIGFFVQFLRSLAKACLDFQVLLEIVLTEFVVELQLVVILLYVQLVGFPQLVGFFCRDERQFLPLVLEFFKLLVGLVGFLRRGTQYLDPFQNLLLFLQVLFFLPVQFSLQFSSFLLDDVHGRLEIVLEHIRCRKESFGFASVFDELRTGCRHVCLMYFVESLFQGVQLLFLGRSVGFGQFLHSCNDFFLCLRHFYRLIFRFVHFRCYVFCYVLFRLESFLRVHHVTCFSI